MSFYIVSQSIDYEGFVSSIIFNTLAEAEAHLLDIKAKSLSDADCIFLSGPFEVGENIICNDRRLIFKRNKETVYLSKYYEY